MCVSVCVPAVLFFPSKNKSEGLVTGRTYCCPTEEARPQPQPRLPNLVSIEILDVKNQLTVPRAGRQFVAWKPGGSPGKEASAPASP